MFFGLMLVPGIPVFIIAKAMGASNGWAAGIYWIVVIVLWILWQLIKDAEARQNQW